MQDVREKLLRIIEDQLPLIARENVTGASRFIEDLGTDSLDIIELIIAVEEDFNIEVPDDCLEDENGMPRIRTFDEAVALVKTLLP